LKFFNQKKGELMAASFQGFRSLIEHSPDAISLIDPHGEVLYASASTTDVLGYQPEELVGQNGWDLIHPEDLAQSQRVLQKVISEPAGPIRWHSRVRRKDGTYSWVESTVSNLLVEPDVQAILVNQRDINARRVVEAESHQHASRVARSSLEIEEFAYTVAHDLREPLRTISAFTELLAQRMQPEGEDREIAEVIINGAARMSTLLEDLLSFASAGVRETPRRIDLRATVVEARQNLAQAIQASGARITVDRLPAVRGHNAQLVSLFQNLIGNAIKYRREESPDIQVTARSIGKDWIVHVRDNGRGIADENKARVFHPITRFPNHDVPGTGFGLAACKKIVEGMGGKIWLDSELGVGSTVSFTIREIDDEIPVAILASQTED